jgi:hypothetical protein
MKTAIQRAIQVTLAVFLLFSYGTANLEAAVGSHDFSCRNTFGVLETPESALFSALLRLSAGDAKPQTITGLDLLLSVVIHGPMDAGDPKGGALILYLAHSTGFSRGLERTDIIYPFHYFL